ncbi:hypothetical protein NDU88_001052 [Pleurodeles waltl]|uniref:Uncharacterized protein n=1 Tax=Pleurodeles waltl TaxID=8319 RepID=A0AAV7LXK7_PLEWA|nr:hypothetical protein NDU88_001052 [Pleurodeles waltl]
MGVKRLEAYADTDGWAAEMRLLSTEMEERAENNPRRLLQVEAAQTAPQLPEGLWATTRVEHRPDTSLAWARPGTVLRQDRGELEEATTHRPREQRSLGQNPASAGPEPGKLGNYPPRATSTTGQQPILGRNPTSAGSEARNRGTPWDRNPPVLGQTWTPGCCWETPDRAHNSQT